MQVLGFKRLLLRVVRVGAVSSFHLRIILVPCHKFIHCASKAGLATVDIG